MIVVTRRIYQNHRGNIDLTIQTRVSKIISFWLTLWYRSPLERSSMIAHVSLSEERWVFCSGLHAIPLFGPQEHIKCRTYQQATYYRHKCVLKYNWYMAETCHYKPLILMQTLTSIRYVDARQVHIVGNIYRWPTNLSTSVNIATKLQTEFCVSFFLLLLQKCS